MKKLKETGLGALSLTIATLQIVLFGATAGVDLFQQIGLQISKIGARLAVAILPSVPFTGTVTAGYGGIIFLLAIFISVYNHERFGL